MQPLALAARLHGAQSYRTRSQTSNRAQQLHPVPLAAPLPLHRPRLPTSTEAAEQPQLGRRRLLGIVPLPLLFLPWSGCDQGGSYSTGIKGTPGKDCQVIYQPAAAAEKRFVEQQRQRQQPQPSSQPQQQQPAPQQAQEALRPAAATEREERATLLKEQAAYERQALAAEQQQRTRAFVDSMWQSLE